MRWKNTCFNYSLNLCELYARDSLAAVTWPKDWSQRTRCFNTAWCPWRDQSCQGLPWYPLSWLGRRNKKEKEMERERHVMKTCSSNQNNKQHVLIKTNVRIHLFTSSIKFCEPNLVIFWRKKIHDLRFRNWWIEYL